MKRLVPFALGALALGWSAAALSDELVIGVRTEPQSIDPHWNSLSGDKQVEQTIAIIVEERRTAGPVWIADPRHVGDIAECSSAVVSKHAIRAVVRHVDVKITIIVNVPNGASYSKSSVAEARVASNIDEPAVWFLTKEAVLDSRAGWKLSNCLWRPATVDQVEIEIAVVVVVEQGSPSTVHFGHEIGTQWPHDVLEVQAHLVCYVHEELRRAAIPRDGGNGFTRLPKTISPLVRRAITEEPKRLRREEAGKNRKNHTDSSDDRRLNHNCLKIWE